MDKETKYKITRKDKKKVKKAVDGWVCLWSTEIMSGMFCLGWGITSMVFSGAIDRGGLIVKGTVSPRGGLHKQPALFAALTESHQRVTAFAIPAVEARRVTDDRADRKRSLYHLQRDRRNRS